MTSGPARLAGISLEFAEISARRDENFPYEHSIPVRRAGNVSFYCSVILLFYYSITLLFYYFIVLLFYYSIVLLFIILLFYYHESL